MPSNPYRAFLRSYYLAAFFYDFIFAYAIYNVLFSLRGLSVFQISLLLAWWALVAMVLEVPTGALADSWSRKSMLAIAPIIKALCFLIWIFADGSFYLYALGFVFWALGSSFVSGTAEALLYDTLKHFGQAEDYERVLGTKKSNFYVGMAIAGTSGGLLANYSLDLAVVVSIVPLILSAFFASLLKEVPKAESTGQARYLEHIRIAFREIRASRVLGNIVIYLLAMSVFCDLEEFDQLYYQMVNLPLFAFGAVSFFGSTMSAIASYYAYRFKGSSAAFYGMPLVSALCLFGVARYPVLPMIGLLLFSYSLVTPVRVLMESNLQHNIASLSRATVTSVSTLLTTLLGVLVTLGYGVISRIWSLQAIYFSTGVALSVFALGVFLFGKRVFPREVNSFDILVPRANRRSRK